MKLTSYIASRSYNSFKNSSTKGIIKLSIIATSLSLSIMIISQSVCNGFQKEVSKKIFGFWGHVQITNIQGKNSFTPAFIKFTDSLLDSIKQMKLPGETEVSIRHLQSYIFYPTIASTKQEFEGLFLKGVGDDFDWIFLSSFLTRGSIISTFDNQNREILISEITASRLLIDTGQSIILNFIVDNQPLKRKMKIVGIYNTGLEEFDRKIAIVSRATLQELVNVEKNDVTGLEIFCNNVLKSDQINNYLYEEILPTHYYSESIRLKFPSLFEWLSLQNISKYFILTLIFLVSLINLSTTSLILVFERTQMIGILTVLGIKRWVLQKIFLRYASRILIRSLLIGSL